MTAIHVERDVHSPRTAVFPCFTDPFALRRWYGAPPGCHRVTATGESMPGELFRIALIGPEGRPFAQVGRLIAVVPPASLELELAWEGLGPTGPPVRATIHLEDRDAATRITVRQGPFSSATQADWHEAFWGACLARLASVAAGVAVPCFEELWAEAGAFEGALGLAAWSVLAGLRESGVTGEALASIETTLYQGLGSLTAEQGATIAAVLQTRLAGEDTRWNGTEAAP